MNRGSMGEPSLTAAADTSRESVLGAIHGALAFEMDRDPRMVILGQDVGRLGGVFRVTRGLQDRFGTDRVFDTPLAEASIAGASLGLALGGLVPVAEIQFLGFTQQAFHQMGAQLGRYRFRSRGRFHCQVTIRAPFGGGTRTPEFHADSIEALFTQTPGIKVVCPAFPDDAKGLLLSAIRDPDPVLFLEPERLYRSVSGSVPSGDYTVPLGTARLVREGKDLTLVSWSAGVHLCLEAAEQLAKLNASVAVLDLRSIVPLDVESLVSAVAATGKAVVVQEAPLTGGFAAEVVATIQEEAFMSLDAPIRRVGGHDTPYPPGSLEDHYLPSLRRVMDAALATLDY